MSEWAGVGETRTIIGKLLLNNEMNGLLMGCHFLMTSRWHMMSMLYFSSF